MENKTEYKADEFIYFIEEPTGEFEEVGAKGGSKRLRPITRTRNIDFDKIDYLDLEKRGEQAPFTSKHVINTPLYLAYYWSELIGPDACWLYIQLLTYCRGERDFLWDALEVLEEKMQCSRPTLKKLLKILEDNNFIIVVRRLNKMNNNRETTPIIKVRQSCPLLSREQYEKLSESSKKQHDKFMAKYGKHNPMDETTYDVQETMDELLQGSKVRVSKRMQEKVDNLIKEDKAFDYILTKLSASDQLKRVELHQLMEEYISKPSRESTYKDCLSFYEESTNSVHMVVTTFGKAVVDATYEAQSKLLRPVFEQLYEIEDFVIKFYSFEDYMIKLERGL